MVFLELSYYIKIFNPKNSYIIYLLLYKLLNIIKPLNNVLKFKFKLFILLYLLDNKIYLILYGITLLKYHIYFYIFNIQLQYYFI